MEIDKQEIIDMLRRRRRGRYVADVAERELPEQVDTDDHRAKLDQLGINPTDLPRGIGGTLASRCSGASWPVGVGPVPAAYHSDLLLVLGMSRSRDRTGPRVEALVVHGRDLRAEEARSRRTVLESTASAPVATAPVSGHQDPTAHGQDLSSQGPSPCS